MLGPTYFSAFFLWKINAFQKIVIILDSTSIFSINQIDQSSLSQPCHRIYPVRTLAFCVLHCHQCLSNSFSPTLSYPNSASHLAQFLLMWFLPKLSIGFLLVLRTITLCYPLGKTHIFGKVDVSFNLQFYNSYYCFLQDS